MINRRSLIHSFLFLLASAIASQAVASDDYREALRLYREARYKEAEPLFKAVVDRDSPDPHTIKSHYFLARTQMKLAKWEEASARLIGIHSLSPIFYREWACDFLLGECRRALGKE